MALLAALRILQMLLAYGDCPEWSIEEVLSEGEQECLGRLNAKMEQPSQRLKNDHDAGTLPWATWIIARLGGWKGYRSQRKPGPIVLHKGLLKFYNIYEGWLLAFPP